jgi:hypothetical protein
MSLAMLEFTQSARVTVCRKAKWAGSPRFSSTGCKSCRRTRKSALTLDAAARDWLAVRAGIPPMARGRRSTDSASRARPLAEMILYGEVKDGDEIAISSESGVLNFNGRPHRRRRSPGSKRRCRNVSLTSVDICRLFRRLPPWRSRDSHSGPTMLLSD